MAEKEVVSVKSLSDLQRLKIEKLMKNQDKLAFIPDKSKDKKFPDAPEFVRNVMGSSAGAGSGEFHVYRHIRRREYTRQEYLQSINDKITLDEEYYSKVAETKNKLEHKTAKKREKRQRLKQKKKMKKVESNSSSESEVDEESLKELLELNKQKETELLKYSKLSNENITTDTSTDR